MTATTRMDPDHATEPATGSPTGVQSLLLRRADLPTSHPDHAALRVSSIEAGLPLARCLAARYRGRGVPLDDLYQVAALALVKAVDGYDPARQTAFTSYAVPTIIGALKRHFRDTTWQVRVPRRIQALALDLAPHRASLSQRLGRSPTLAELAAHLNAAEPDVAIALNAWQARHPDSLDVVTSDGEQQRRPLIDTLGGIDARFDAVADRQTLRPLLAGLPVRQRRILAMRFFGEMTQAEIASQIGVSQMHVSRLLAAALTQLRTELLAPPSHPTSRAPAQSAPGAPLAGQSNGAAPARTSLAVSGGYLPGRPRTSDPISRPEGLGGPRAGARVNGSASSGWKATAARPPR